MSKRQDTEKCARISGCDFGINHPVVGCELAWDRERDVVYVIETIKKEPAQGDCR